MNVYVDVDRSVFRREAPKGEVIEARWVECHCGAAQIHTHGGNVGEAVKVTGWTPIMNSSCGFTWICSACLPKVKTALNLLREHFGADASHMHYPGLIIRLEEGRL